MITGVSQIEAFNSNLQKKEKKAITMPACELWREVLNL